MQYYSKEIRIAFFSLVAGLFLLSGTHSSFSQEELPEISDEDLDLLEEYLEQANELFEEENYGEAISYYDQVLSIDSTDIDALNGKAFALDLIGIPEEAILYFDKVLSIDSSNKDALFGTALALENLGRDEEAISFYNKVLAIEIDEQLPQKISDEDSDLLEEYLEQAEELFEEESYQEAISYYDQVLEIDSTNNDAFLGKALALESLGRDEESLSNLEQITIQDPPKPLLEILPGDAENLFESEKIEESDQTLFAIMTIIIAGLVSIIAVDFIARRRRNVSDALTIRAPKQTIFSKPSSDSDSSQKENDFNPISLDVATNSEVSRAMKTLSNLREMNMLDDPKTAKQFLLMKGFSRNSVKNALLGMGIDSSYVTDL